MWRRKDKYQVCQQIEPIPRELLFEWLNKLVQMQNVKYIFTMVLLYSCDCRTELEVSDKCNVYELQG